MSPLREDAERCAWLADEQRSWSWAAPSPSDQYDETTWAWAAG